MDSGLPLGAAVWLGVVTALSPCLMATNAAAIAFLARRVDKPRHVLLAGLVYTAAQALTYVALGTLLVSSLLSVPVVSVWLQRYMTRLLGPLLLVAAVFLLEWVRPPVGGGPLKQWAQARADAGGLTFAALLGAVFALSFCPVTAALFFGSLVPIAVARGSMVLLPLLYALGVALPVLLLALVIALSAHRLGALFSRLTQVEHWARRLTGAIFLAVGAYFTWAFTLAQR